MHLINCQFCNPCPCMVLQSLGMESTFNEYKAWIEGDVDEETQQCYDKAMSLLAKLKPFEDSLVN